MPILGTPCLTVPLPEQADPMTRRLYAVRQSHPQMACPSDTASWLDCVLHDEPCFDPAAAGAWGDDWADRWTITLKDAARGDLTSTVARTGTSMFDAAESVRRMTNRYSQPNRTGIAYLASTGRHHAFESLTERGVLRLIDFSEPWDVVTQPLWLTWHDGARRRRHAPDFLVRGRDGTTVVNVRPADLIDAESEEQFAAMTAVAHRLGWRHVVVTGLIAPHATTIDTLAVARTEPHDPFGLADDLQQALAQAPAPFATLVAGTRAPALARAVLLGMLWRREAAVDLAGRLCDQSVVRLGTATR